MTIDEPPDEPAPVRRPKRWHAPGLESIDWSRVNIDWDNEPMLTLEEGEAQARRWRSRLRQMHRVPGERANYEWSRIKAWRQKASRGWSDRELWNLDTHLCQHLGGMLVAHAEGAVNYPDEMTYDEWRRQVRRAGDALLAYDPEDARRVAEARTALRWVTHNLVDLWD